MKPFLLFCWLAIASTLLGAIPGTTQLTAPAAPPATNSNLGASLPRYNYGGALTGGTIANYRDLNWYPLARRTGHAGMLAIDNVTTNIYQLSADLTNWNQVFFPSYVAERIYQTQPSLSDFSTLVSAAAYTNYPVIRVRDVGDGTGGVARWDPTATGPTNMRAFAYPPAASTGRWIVDPGQFGAVSLSTIMYAFGDSIMHGAAVALGTPWLRFPDLVASANGWTPRNTAYGGERFADVAWTVMPGYSYTNVDFVPNLIATTPASFTEDMVSIFMLGYNDMRDAGLNSTAMTSARRALAHILAWTCIPASNKKVAQQADLVVGTWTPQPWWTGDIATASSGGGDSLSFSNIVGNTIYVAVMAHPATNDNRSFSVLIDALGYPGNVPGPAIGNRFYDGGNIFQPTYIGPNLDGSINMVPWVFRFSGLSRTAHTVKVTVTGSTDGPIEVLYVAGNGAVRNPRKGPYALVGNTLRPTEAGKGVGSVLAAGGWSRQIQDVVGLFQADGIPVVYVDPNRFVDPLTMISGDNVHPTEAGHAAIARAYQMALASDIPQISATRQIPPQLMEVDGDMVTMLIPGTTGSSFRAPKWHGGSLPFFQFDMGAPLVDGNMWEIDATPASTTGLQYIFKLSINDAQSNNGRVVGFNLAMTENNPTTAVAGPSYPILIANSRSNYVANLLRITSGGDWIVEGFSTNIGRTITFQGQDGTHGATNNEGSGSITLHFASTVTNNPAHYPLDWSVRNMNITPNALFVQDASNNVANISLGNGGNVVVSGIDDSSGVRLGTSGGVSWTKGDGSPEGINSAPIGSIRSQTDGVPGSAVWLRTTTSGTETNWRQITDQSRVAPQPQVLTDGSTITWNMTNTLVVQNATVTLGGNRTLDLEGLVSGMRGSLQIRQDGTGSRTLSPGNGITNYIPGNITTFPLSTLPNAVDIWNWYFVSPNVYWSRGYGLTAYPGIGFTDLSGNIANSQLPTNVVIQGTLQVTGAVTNLSTLGIAGVSTFSGKITPAAGIVGVAGTASAATGNVGEYLSASLASASAQALTTAVYTNLASVTLTAGDWDLFGSVTFVTTTAATTGFIGGIGTTANASLAESNFFNIPLVSGSLSSPMSFPVPHQRVSISGTTTYYLNCRGVFSAGSETAYGRIEARRSANSN